MMWLKRLWWRITKQPTLAQYGERVTLTNTMELRKAMLGPIPPEGKTINFVKTRPLRDFLPTDLDTPESQEALAELNEAQKEAQTPPADH